MEVRFPCWPCKSDELLVLDAAQGAEAQSSFFQETNQLMCVASLRRTAWSASLRLARCVS